MSNCAITWARAFGIGVLRLIRIEEVVGSIPTTSMDSSFFAPLEMLIFIFCVYPHFTWQVNQSVPRAESFGDALLLSILTKAFLSGHRCADSTNELLASKILILFGNPCSI